MQDLGHYRRLVLAWVPHSYGLFTPKVVFASFTASRRITP